MSTASSNLLHEIDGMIASRHLLTHPFYQAWTRGKLSIDALRDYAAQYYHHVAAFPTYLSAVHANTDDLAARRHILSNLMDEEAGSPNHPELWLDFASSLGVAPVDVQSAQLWPETRQLIAAFRDVCRKGSTEDGLAALYAYESQIPAVAESKIDGLRRFYHVSSREGLAYFEVHKEADREHAAVERDLLGRRITGESAASVKRSVATVLNALWEMLSGVCRRHAIAC
jgi:pyrroloquinoline-quinone synthase